MIEICFPFLKELAGGSIWIHHMPQDFQYITITFMSSQSISFPPVQLLSQPCLLRRCKYWPLVNFWGASLTNSSITRRLYCITMWSQRIFVSGFGVSTALVMHIPGADPLLTGPLELKGCLLRRLFYGSIVKTMFSERCAASAPSTKVLEIYILNQPYMWRLVHHSLANMSLAVRLSVADT